MNWVGIMVDIFYVFDSIFWQVMEMMDVFCIVLYFFCCKFILGFECNMNDDMICCLVENNGVMQINFGFIFFDGNILKQMDEKWVEFIWLLEEKGLSYDDEEV